MGCREVKGEGVKGYKGLKVWQSAKDLAVYIYKITNENSFSKDFALKEQIRRSAISVVSNIAEGEGRDTNKDKVKFLHIAKGSLTELQTQIQISYEIGYINQEIYFKIDENIENLANMIGGLIKYRKRVNEVKRSK